MCTCSVMVALESPPSGRRSDTLYLTQADTTVMLLHSSDIIQKWTTSILKTELSGAKWRLSNMTTSIGAFSTTAVRRNSMRTTIGS